MPVNFDIDSGVFFQELYESHPPRDLCAIVAHLQGLQPEEVLKYLSKEGAFVGRHAPSMVTRNEAELFGLSAPRFACRMRLTNQSTFFNLRRLPSFIRAVRQQLQNTNCDKHANQETLEQFCTSMQDLCGVADCIIELPPKYQTPDYVVLTTDLWEEFGEAAETREQPQIRRIPFVKHAPLGGGQCAPACSWMITAMLSRHAKNLHGLTDVNFLAKGGSATPDPDPTIILGQLSVRRLARYLVRGAGLRMATFTIQTTGPDRLPLRGEFGIMKVASTYLTSGFPLAMMVSWNRLQTQVLEKTSLPDGSNVSNYLNQMQLPHDLDGHMITVVGYKCDGPPVLLVNDPSSLPLLEVTPGQSINISISTPSVQPDCVYGVTALFAVVPERVQFHPFPYQATDADKTSDKEPDLVGISDVLGHLQVTYYGSSSEDGLRCLADYLSNASPSELASGIRDPVIKESEFTLLHKESLANHSVIAAELSSAFPCEWVWVQRFNPPSGNGHQPTLWIWNAEITPMLAKDFRAATPEEQERIYKTVILAVISTDGEELLYPKILPENNQCGLETKSAECEVQPQLTSIRPSLISSFTTERDYSELHWPPHTKHCEAYLLMHRDAQKLQQAMVTACKCEPQAESYSPDVLLACIGNPERLLAHFNISPSLEKDSIVQCLDAVVSMLSLTARGDQFQLDTIGIATFISGLSFPEKHPQAALARDAVAGALLVGAHLRKHSDGSQGVHFVEVVCGTRIASIELESGQLGVTIMTDDEAAANLIRNLEAVYQNVKRVMNILGRDMSSVPYLSLELEPGPLYCLRDHSTLDRICQRIHESADIRCHVGINLDVSHFMLTKHCRCGDLTMDTPLDIQNFPSSARLRICHAHISGHSELGHISDVAVPGGASRLEFYKWLQFYEQCVTSADERAVLPSGFVSVELEACPNPDLVSFSVQGLIELLEGKT